MRIELLLLVISVLFFASIIVSKVSSKFGVPVLLLFLGVGMLFGVDGLGIHFDNFKITQTIGTVALCIILFSGGMDTKIKDVKPVIAPGVTLATLGVLLTAAITGIMVWLIMDKTPIGVNIGLYCSLLMAATISSTDSASVFSILRSKGLYLKNNIKPTLELESGSNDPMAYMLTITLISIVNQSGESHIGITVLQLAVQLVMGVLAGYVIGKSMVWIINRIRIENESLYPILVFTACIFIFAVTYYMQGNSYLAVYIGGLVIGNSKFVHKRSTRNFFDGISWLSQLVMFLMLGLLVNPSDLTWNEVILPSIIVSAVMIFVSRPFAVFVSLLPFRKFRMRDKTFISWCGLRGAVPIIFAIMCYAENVPHSEVIFNMVFFCTLMSLILQGTTLPLVAKILKVDEKVVPKSKIENFDIDFPEEIKSATSEILITPKMLSNGSCVMDLRMPEKTLVIMIKRGDVFFVPTGKTVLKEGDRMMVITDDEEALKQTVNELENR
ncbi:MAG: potassium/proton antiporter [Bacteroidales bacterium]|nr:potassium/proton antiporter [Bacteroidales bacterium]MBQ6275402.1 potassium/proton antiporter [Bacteroidales bacterium]